MPPSWRYQGSWQRALNAARASLSVAKLRPRDALYYAHTLAGRAEGFRRRDHAWPAPLAEG